MRNPDKWGPEESGEPDASKPPGENEEPEPPGARRGALVGLILVVLLVIGGVVLAHVLRDMSRYQDCVLSGRSNCS